MADYTFEDSARTVRVNAFQDDIIQYKGVRLYCRNPRCNAHMFIHNPENPQDAYFQAHGTPSHYGYCGCQGAQHFERNEYDELAFHMPDAIENLINHSDGNGGIGEYHGDGNRINIYPPRTIRQIYTMCVNTPPDGTYNDIPIHEILAGEDTKEYYCNGINGHRIAECSYYRYLDDVKVLYMNFPFHGWNRNIELWFNDLDLFCWAKGYLYDPSHKSISVIAGEFHTNERDDICHVSIVSKKQLYRFR